MATNKLSDFLDPNLNNLMDQPEREILCLSHSPDQLKGEEQERALCEALRVIYLITKSIN